MDHGKVWRVGCGGGLLPTYMYSSIGLAYLQTFFFSQNGDYHELRTSFTGSTFQPPDLANRPLPDEPSSTLPNSGSRNLAYNAQGEPVLVAELI